MNARTSMRNEGIAKSRTVSTFEESGSVPPASTLWSRNFTDSCSNCYLFRLTFNPAARKNPLVFLSCFPKIIIAKIPCPGLTGLRYRQHTGCIKKGNRALQCFSAFIIQSTEIILSQAKIPDF